MSEKKDPFAELETRARRVTPRLLHGKNKEVWEKFIKNYCEGKYAGISLKELHDWATRNCGLNCSLSCFRQELAHRSERYAQ